MPHLHPLIDFTIAAYIVHQNKVLLIDHKRLETWLPIGGHIELDEDPEEALLREIQEESGLSETELGEPEYNITPPIQFYAREALKKLG